jgi:LPS export ABC transporter protein LptC
MSLCGLRASPPFKWWKMQIKIKYVSKPVKKHSASFQFSIFTFQFVSINMQCFYRNISITAALFSCIFLFSCENDAAKVNNIGKKNTGIEEAKSIVLNYTIGGHSRAILTSPLMLNVQDAVPYVEFPNKLHADFYNEFGKIESIMNAHYAKYTQYQSVVYLKDSVVVINLEKGDTLYCDELFWDRNRLGTEFYTDKPVRIRTKTETINGRGMESSQDFKNWHIIHSIGNISLPANKFPGG